jgi:SAM-dependent methyltransferase
VDVSAATVQRLRADLGLRALVGSLPHPELAAGTFDVVTMWHALEHAPRPLEVLRAAHRLLTPGGKLIVQTPNIDSLPFRWFGAAWFGLDLPRHLTHFAPPTLTLMLQRAGFRPLPVRMIRHSDWMRCSAQRALDLAGAATPDHWCRLLAGKPLSRLATWYSYLTGQADCILVKADK